jgi:hypothetical protein
MVSANLALRFVVELVGVGALGSSALQVPVSGPARIVLAIGAPLALIVIWAVVVAPRTANALSQPQKDAIGTGLLVAAAVSLGAAGQPAAAAVFGAVVVLNWLALVVIGPEAAAASIDAATGRIH